jgi:hypothetical protein
MDMVPVSDFEHELRPIAVGCMPDLLPRHIITSAIRFCKDTGIVMAELNLTATEQDETIDIATELTAIGFDMTGLIVVDVLQMTAAGDPLYVGADYSEKGRGTITLFDIQESVIIYAALAPSRSATQLPAELFDDWLEPILAGAASSLYLLPEMQDGGASAVHEQAYVEGMRKAKRWRIESLPHVRFSPTTNKLRGLL